MNSNELTIQHASPRSNIIVNIMFVHNEGFILCYIHITNFDSSRTIHHNQQFEEAIPRTTGC